jgi:hypothetical protein
MKRKVMNKSALKTNPTLQPAPVSSSNFESEVTAAIDMLLAKSHQDIQEGKTLDHAAVMQQAAQWLKINPTDSASFTPFEKAIIEQSLREIEAGLGIPNAVVFKEAAQWLKEK